MKLEFVKYQGAGNDFVIVNARERKKKFRAEVVERFVVVSSESAPMDS